MEIPFDSCSIADLCETIGSPTKYLGFMVSESKWSTSFPGFLIINSLAATWSPNHSYLGGRIPVLWRYVSLLLTVGHPNIFLHNHPLFSTPLHL